MFGLVISFGISRFTTDLYPAGDWGAGAGGLGAAHGGTQRWGEEEAVEEVDFRLRWDDFRLGFLMIFDGIWDDFRWDSDAI